MPAAGRGGFRFFWHRLCPLCPDLDALQIALNESADILGAIPHERTSLDEGASLSQGSIPSHRGYAAVSYARVLVFIEKSFEWFFCYALAFAQLRSIHILLLGENSTGRNDWSAKTTLS